MSERDTVLDPALFCEAPARDARFEVKERWSECRNLPEAHPEKEAEFLHRQMNEEVNGLENSARCLADFPDADWELRMYLARQCADEARHAKMFRRAYEAHGGHIGKYPVLNFQYRIVSRIPHLAGRLAVQNRSFEAEGIDAIRHGLDEAREAGNTEMAALLDAQLADEVAHVRFANEWIRKRVKEEPRTAMLVAQAVAEAARAFQIVVGDEGQAGVRYFVDKELRLEAGFLPDEVRVAEEAAKARRPGGENPPENG